MSSKTLRLLVALSASTAVLAGCAAKFRAISSGQTDTSASRDSGEAEGRNVRTIEVTQDERSRVADLLQQGSAGNDKDKNFNQAAGAGVLDIVVVVDNSGSMAEEQANLSTKLAPLLDAVKNSDWRVGVMTTDPAKRCLVGLIMKGDAGAETKFKDLVTAGVNGSGIERGIENAEKGLNCPSTKWVRGAGTVASLIVSDEDNCSKGSSVASNVTQDGTCRQPYAYTPANHVKFLKDTMKREPGKDARVYGLIKIPGDATCTTAFNDSKDYNQLITDTKGMAGSICSNDYTNVLKKISENIATTLESAVDLGETPNAGSVVVTIDGALLPASEYTVTGTVVKFNTPPPLGKTVKISYKTDVGEQKTVFELKEVPVAGTVEVLIDGVAVPSSDYTVDYAGKKITFATAPAPGKMISVSYRIEDSSTPLKNEFQIEKDLPSDSIVVLVNGKKVTDYEYDAATGVLHFHTAPEDGAKIVVEIPEGAGTKFFGTQSVL